MNHLVANEIALKFNRRITFHNHDSQPRDDSFEGIKPCLSFWYLIDRSGELPLAGEFSFDYDALNTGTPEQLEAFPMSAVVGAEQLFKALKKQANWMNPTSTTKTTYAYSGF